MAAMLSSRLRYLPKCSRWFFACKPRRGAQKADGLKFTECLGNISTRRCLSTLSGTNRTSLAVQLTCNGHRNDFHTSSINHSDSQIVNCPPFAESITEGDLSWEKGVGDFVKEDEQVGSVATDKTDVEIRTPCAGIIEELLIADGETISPGMPLFKVKPGTAPAKSEAKPPPVAASEAPPPPAASPTPAPPPPTSSAGPIPTSPPPVTPLPTKPTSSKPASSVPIKSVPQSGATYMPGTRTEQRVKMSRMRLRISERLKEAQNTCAMLTTFNEIDMSNIVEMRNKYKDTFQKKTGLKLGFMSAFVKASAYALQDQPVVNALIDGSEIVYRDYVDISVAVSTPKGLVVPVLRNVETMNFADIERQINEFGQLARDMKLAIEDMEGGTFTISNGGVFGSMFGTPIINPPQSAILGMHGIFDRPVAINGQVEIRPMMYVALTYDHRLIDGREAVTFLRKIKSCVEDPRTILLAL